MITQCFRSLRAASDVVRADDTAQLRARELADIPTTLPYSGGPLEVEITPETLPDRLAELFDRASRTTHRVTGAALGTGKNAVSRQHRELPWVPLGTAPAQLASGIIRYDILKRFSIGLPQLTPSSPPGKALQVLPVDSRR